MASWKWGGGRGEAKEKNWRSRYLRPWARPGKPCREYEAAWSPPVLSGTRSWEGVCWSYRWERLSALWTGPCSQASLSWAALPTLPTSVRWTASISSSWSAIQRFYLSISELSFLFFFFSTLSFPVRRRSIIARSIDEERVYLSTPLPFLSKLPDARSQFDPLDNFYLTHGSRLGRDFGSGQYLQHLHVVFPLVRFDRSTQFRHYPLPGIGKIIEREIELFRYYPLTWMAREQKEQDEGRKGERGARREWIS